MMTAADLNRISSETGYDFTAALANGSSAINSFFRGVLGIGIWLALGVALVLTFGQSKLQTKKA